MAVKQYTHQNDSERTKKRTSKPVSQNTQAVGQSGLRLQRVRLHSHSLTPEDVLQLQSAIGNRAVGRLLSKVRPGVEPAHAAKEPTPNRTGLPDDLKAGIENLSGLSMDDVRVHYNSPKPAEFAALAYTQGTEIHVAPGQEKHLPHEAWHVVQQKHGRVKPMLQVKGVAINVDAGLEHEADAMGVKAAEHHAPRLIEPGPIASSRVGALLGTSTAEAPATQAKRSVATWIGPSVALSSSSGLAGADGVPIQMARGKMNKKYPVNPPHQLKEGDEIEYEENAGFITITQVNGKQLLRPLKVPMFQIKNFIDDLPEAGGERERVVPLESGNGDGERTKAPAAVKRSGFVRSPSMELLESRGKGTASPVSSSMGSPRLSREKGGSALVPSAETLTIEQGEIETVKRSEAGVAGVWFFGSQEKGTLVVKEHTHSVKQAIATKWMRAMNFHCPDVRVISKESEEGKRLISLCTRLYKGEHRKLGEAANAKYLQIMEFVQGRCVTDMSEMEAADVRALNDRENQIAIGRMTVCDVLLRNPDRFRLETSAGLHTGNLMFTARDNVIVPIDNEMLATSEGHLAFVEAFVKDILEKKGKYAEMVCKYLRGEIKNKQEGKEQVSKPRGKSTGLARLRALAALEKSGVAEVQLDSLCVLQGMTEAVREIAGRAAGISSLLKRLYKELGVAEEDSEKQEIMGIIDGVERVAQRIAGIYNEKMKE